MRNKNTKFIYLISPNKINKQFFFKDLVLVLKSNKVKYFQLRLKKESFKEKITVAKKVIKICKKYNVKFIINDDPYLTIKVNADGCHLGQKDMEISKARKILKNKIIGIPCHNSIKLAKKAHLEKEIYIAIGSFFKSKTKKVIYKANMKLLRKIKKLIKIPIVTIGGINEKNYENLLLNKADFLAISGYVWKNEKLKPYQAIRRLK